MADETLHYTSETDLQALAEAHGYRYERSKDNRQEFVIDHAGTVVITAWRVVPEKRGEKKKDPTVWVRQIQECKTYRNHPIAVGDVYLIHEDEVENIVHGLKFAVRDTPPPKAIRTP